MKNLDSIQNNKISGNQKPPTPHLSSSFKTPSTFSPTPPPRHKKSRTLKSLLTLILLAILMLGGVVIARFVNLSNEIFVGRTTTFWGQVKNIIGVGEPKQLIGEKEYGQINILLLGIGGEGHDGPYLTDTMIVAQIRPSDGLASLVSVPRDYAVNLPENLGERKINSAFAEGFARSKNFNTAGFWARQVAEKVSGLPIPYFAIVDFNGFKKAIDQVGGIDVTIDQTFTDAEYPNETLGYLPPVTFKAGPEHMDGNRALIFARSRHGNNNESSDFARSRRQKKIIDAFKEKILKLSPITDVGTLNNLLGTFAEHFHTNLTLSELFRLYGLNQEKPFSFISASLDAQAGLLCDGKQEITESYIIFPCSGKTTTDIQNFFKNSFTIGKISEEKPVIWLANSTNNSKRYTDAQKLLQNAGAKVFELSYSPDNLPQTVYYQVNPKTATAEFIKNSLQATEATLPPPDVTINKDRVDVIVILGEKNN